MARPRLLPFTLPLALLVLCNSPAGAFDLFATHEVSVQFATQDGKPLADAEVRVFAPGDLTHVERTGRTDKNGKFEFGVAKDGLWTAEARTGSEVARATMRVGKLDEEKGGLSPALAIGVLGVLLAVAVWYRFLRARARR